MLRTTRSGAIFSGWDGPIAAPSVVQFDLPAALKLAIQHAVDKDPGPADYELSLETSDPPAILPPNAVPSKLPTTQPSKRIHTDEVDGRKNAKKQRGTHGTSKLGTEAQDKRKAAKKQRSRNHCRKLRAELNEEAFSHHAVRPAIAKKYITPAQVLRTTMEAGSAPAASTAYVGLNDSETRGSCNVHLDELVGEGSKYNFKYISWDGECSIPIVSKDGYLLSVLASSPDPQEWQRLQKQGANALEQARLECDRPETHRRGDFAALRCGVTHGNGTTKPCNHSNTKKNTEILERLNGLEVFRRLAGFASSVMSSWAPDLHTYYTTTLKKLHKHDPGLKRLFRSSVFSASTYNLGPRTICYKHTDFANLPFGWCAITAFGSYDHKKGGHLVLWDCGLVIEFPPGYTILIPSAIVAHSNVPISPHEKRYSFTQYTAGGIFRWVENNFQKGPRFYASLSEEERAAQGVHDANRWEYGLSLIPFVEDAGEAENTDTPV